MLQVAGKKRGDHHHSRTYFTTIQSGRFAGGGNDCRVGEIGGENGRRSVGDIWTGEWRDADLMPRTRLSPAVWARVHGNPEASLVTGGPEGPKLTSSSSYKVGVK